MSRDSAKKKYMRRHTIPQIKQNTFQTPWACNSSISFFFLHKIHLKNIVWERAKQRTLSIAFVRFALGLRFMFQALNLVFSASAFPHFNINYRAHHKTWANVIAFIYARFFSFCCWVMAGRGDLSIQRKYILAWEIERSNKQKLLSIGKYAIVFVGVWKSSDVGLERENSHWVTERYKVWSNFLKRMSLPDFFVGWVLLAVLARAGSSWEKTKIFKYIRKLHARHSDVSKCDKREARKNEYVIIALCNTSETVTEERKKEHSDLVTKLSEHKYPTRKTFMLMKL